MKKEIEKLDLNTTVESKDIDGSKLAQDCFVDLDQPPKSPEVVVFFGVDERGRKVKTMTRGEYSCLVAPSKSKKSFNKSLIAGAYIGGKTEEYTDLIVSNRKDDRYIIDIDTEQGEFYSYLTFNRVRRLTGGNYKQYRPYWTRKKSIAERIELIRWVLYDSEYAGKIDLLFIDGIADLVSNTNDLEKSNEVSDLLLKWSAECNIHICVVIHKVWNADKATGHLGTTVTKKAESIIFIEPLLNDQGKIRERNTVKIRCGYSRGLPFEEFYMTINNEGLPFTHSFETDNIFQPLTERKKEIAELRENRTPFIDPDDAFDPPPELLDEDDDDVPF
ncbi:hypothetical protein [Galbibacter sp. BG1]